MSVPQVMDTSQLSEQLSGLGLRRDRDVLVHCSMRAIGPITDGPATMCAAIQAVIGPEATVVVPTQTPNNSTTSPAFRHAVRGLDETATAAYIAQMPGFDQSSPSHGMGVLAEYVRRHPATVRSRHPQTSFAALGPAAARLMDTHDLDSHLGERSPLAALYQADASVLLLGVSYAVCTSFHLAEYRLPTQKTRDYQCFIRLGSARAQCDFRAVDLEDRDFVDLGEAFERDCGITPAGVGKAVARAFPVRQAVDYAVEWMMAHRSA